MELPMRVDAVIKAVCPAKVVGWVKCMKSRGPPVIIEAPRAVERARAPAALPPSVRISNSELVGGVSQVVRW